MDEEDFVEIGRRPRRLRIARPRDERIPIRALADGLDAHTTVGILLVEKGSARLVRFFDSLAADWQGWTGTRSWLETEGQAGISAEHDRVGHVHLTVDLADSVYRNWSVRVQIDVEPGSLATTTRSLRRVFDHT